MAVSKELERLASSAGWYAKGWRKVVEADNGGNGGMRIKDPFDSFCREVSVSEMRAKMRKALDRRINSRGGNEAANEEIPLELLRDAWAVNDYKSNRIRFDL